MRLSPVCCQSALPPLTVSLQLISTHLPDSVLSALLLSYSPWPSAASILLNMLSCFAFLSWRFPYPFFLLCCLIPLQGRDVCSGLWGMSAWPPCQVLRRFPWKDMDTKGSWAGIVPSPSFLLAACGLQTISWELLLKGLTFMPTAVLSGAYSRSHSVQIPALSSDLWYNCRQVALSLFLK